MTPEQQVAKVKKAFERIVRGVNFRVVSEPIGSWIAIEFEQLDVEDIESITRFIRYYFKPTDKKPYLYRSPKFGISQGGYPAIKIDENIIEEVFGSLD